MFGDDRVTVIGFLNRSALLGDDVLEDSCLLNVGMTEGVIVNTAAMGVDALELGFRSRMSAYLFATRLSVATNILSHCSDLSGMSLPDPSTASITHCSA